MKENEDMAETVQQDLDGNPVEENEVTQEQVTIVTFKVDGWSLKAKEEALLDVQGEDDEKKRLAFVQKKIRPPKDLPVNEGEWDKAVKTVLGMIENWGG